MTDIEMIAVQHGKFGLFGLEDLVHEPYAAGPHFTQVSDILKPSELSAPGGGFVCKRYSWADGRSNVNQRSPVSAGKCWGYPMALTAPSSHAAVTGFWSE